MDAAFGYSIPAAHAIRAFTTNSLAILAEIDRLSMSAPFQDRIKKTPRPFEPEHKAQVLEAYGGAVAPEFMELLAGTGCCSPYLRSLMLDDRDWVAGMSRETPEAAFEKVIAGVAAESPPDLERELRRGKKRVALLTALADLGGVWSLDEVTGSLTRFAEFAADRALRSHLAKQLARDGVKAEGLGGSCGGLFILAMGKMGAGELNYSSDIDLIALFDDSQYEGLELQEARTRFVRVVRGMCKSLSDVAQGGYVFRTDLRLRPNPSVTPVCQTVSVAMKYYQSTARAWERGAFVKARPCAGDIGAGERFLERLTSFVWRRNLDFTAVEDAESMRRKIWEHNSLGGELKLEGHNVKLGRGGIREIEFFTQAMQLIAGGNDPELRVRATAPALRKLAEKGWIEELKAEEIIETLVFHRGVEHRLQMVNDIQTHKLPTEESEFRRLVALFGHDDVAAWRKEMAERTERVHDLTESFYAPVQKAPAESIQADAWVEREVESWMALPALRSERARAIFARAKPVILREFLDAESPEDVLRQFGSMLASMAAGARFFALLESNPVLLKYIVDICSATPSVSKGLSSYPGALDTILSPDFENDLPSLDDMAAELSSAMKTAGDYEQKLDASRRWMRAKHFRIGIRFLQRANSASKTAELYSSLAEAVLKALWPEVCARFAKTHGPPPGRGAVIMALGSLGAGRLTSKSDLDLIVLYDAQGQEASEGDKPLETAKYYSRLTQALITALRSPTGEGILYAVDLRLRPSGRQGMVATSISSFAEYQDKQAWTWEHLALTKARAVAGDEGLAADIEAARMKVLGKESDAKKVLADVADMRSRLEEAESKSKADDVWDSKTGPGQTRDIELLCQAGTLLAGAGERSVARQLEVCARTGFLAEAQAKKLLDAHDLQQKVQLVARLAVDDRFIPGETTVGTRSFLLDVCGAGSLEELERRLDDNRREAEGVIDSILSGASALEVGRGADGRKS